MPRPILFYAIALFLAGCGDLSHDVSHKTAYKRGGCIPGHIYRLKSDAAVVTKVGYSALSLVREEDLHRKPLDQIKWHREWCVPAGSKLRIDSIYHHWIVAITEDNWLLVYGTVLDGRHEKFSVQISYGFTHPESARPHIPTLDHRYLEDITPPLSFKRAQRTMSNQTMQLTPSRNAFTFDHD
jgi:hypothetical protein